MGTGNWLFELRSISVSFQVFLNTTNQWAYSEKFNDYIYPSIREVNNYFSFIRSLSLEIKDLYSPDVFSQPCFSIWLFIANDKRTMQPSVFENQAKFYCNYSSSNGVFIHIISKSTLDPSAVNDSMPISSIVELTSAPLLFVVKLLPMPNWKKLINIPTL